MDRSMGCPGPQGHWPPWLTYAFHGANLVLTLGYAAVPVIVLRKWRYGRRGLSTVRLWLIFAFFPITSLSRLSRVLESGGPPYHLTTILDVLDAASLLVALAILPSKLDHVLGQPTHDRIHSLNEQLRVANAQLATANEQLRVLVASEKLREAELVAILHAHEAKLVEAEEQVAQLRHQRESADWWKSRRDALDEVHGMLAEVVARRPDP